MTTSPAPHAAAPVNVTVGNSGRKVHRAYLAHNGQASTVCGAERRGVGVTHTRRTDKPVDCLACSPSSAAAPVAPATVIVPDAGTVAMRAALVAAREAREAGVEVTTDPAELAIIAERAAQLDALPTDDEPAGEPIEVEGPVVTTRTVGRDLYEVVVDGTAAGRVAMVTGAMWVGYDLGGTARTGDLDSLAEAVAAVVALGATPADPHGDEAAEHAPVAGSATACRCGRTFGSHMGRRNHLTATAVATWGGRLGDGPAALRVLAAEATRDEVTATVPDLDALRREVTAREGDLLAAREAETLAKGGTDPREAKLSSRRRRAAGRRLARAQAALAAAED